MNKRNQKIRRRDFTMDVCDNYDQDFDQLDVNEIVHIKFQNNDPDIVLDRKINHILTRNNCKNDAMINSILTSPEYWHSVTVHHQGGFSKAEINQGLEDLVNNHFFVPISYQSGKLEDSFYIHNQSAALNNMINKNLETIIGNRRLTLTIKLGVARYEKGQINPKEKIDTAIADVINKYREERLDFSYFHKHRFFTDMHLSLKIKGCFEVFCELLIRALCSVRYKMVISTLKILVLVGNDIRHLQYLTKFIRCSQLQNISLKNNAIDSIEEFEALKHLKLKSLSISNNPVIRSDSNIADQVLRILTTLEKLDIKRVKASEATELAKEITIAPTTDEIFRADDITERLKLEFPKKEFVKAFWSTVIIEHQGRFDGKEILEEMFRVFFDEQPCFPCYYTPGELEDSFKICHAFGPLNVLVQNDLKMQVPYTNEFVTFRLHLKSASVALSDVKWAEVISKVIEKRLKVNKLDLSNFQNDHEFRNIIVNMTSNEVKRNVIRCACNKNLKIMEIDLSNNQIKSCKGLELIKMLAELVSLNLSNNLIESLDGLPDHLNILEVFLNKNPVCDTFKSPNSTPHDYVKTFVKLYPKLQYIDGRKIDPNYKMIHFQNYLPSPLAHPAVERFVKFFFQNFDIMSARAMTLCKAFYGPDSIVSVTYGSEKPIVKIGYDEIRAFYLSFSNTEHEYITMTVDAPMFSSRNIIIVVNGVFKKKDFDSINGEDILHTFSRTFVLRKDKSVKNPRTSGTLSDTFNFEIQNEMLHFDVLTDSRIKNKSFKRQQATENEIERAFDDNKFDKNKYTANLDLFRQTTLLTDKWCNRLMEEAHGDFKTALNFYIEFFKRQIFKKEDFTFK